MKIFLFYINNIMHILLIILLVCLILIRVMIGKNVYETYSGGGVTTISGSNRTANGVKNHSGAQSHVGINGKGGSGYGNRWDFYRYPYFIRSYYGPYDDPYYFPTSCMNTLFGDVRCFDYGYYAWSGIW